MSRALPAVLTAVVALMVLAPAAVAGGRAHSAADPALTVSRHQLARALDCAPLRRSARTPVLLVTGTGLPGSISWDWGFRRALAADGHPGCVVDLPANTTGDMQTATEHVVFAIRRMAARAGRDVAVYGISQGAVLPRLALTFWPHTRRLVTDVLALAGTQHGTTPTCRVLRVCPPAGWQQGRGSRLLRALNRQPDESPGPAAWTTMRSTSDTVVVPAGGSEPTSALRGASNLVVQEVCPGRTTSHIGVAFDSVSYAALLDALRHPGPARASRLPAGVCATPFAPRLNQALVSDLVDLAGRIAVDNLIAGPLVRQEPRLRPPFSRPATAGRPSSGARGVS